MFLICSSAVEVRGRKSWGWLLGEARSPTQQVKRNAMKAGNIADNGVIFVSIDFRSEDWVKNK